MHCNSCCHAPFFTPIILPYHEEELNGFYVTFKDVIELGWTLNNNDAVSEAMSFAQKYYKNTD